MRVEGDKEVFGSEEACGVAVWDCDCEMGSCVPGASIGSARERMLRGAVVRWVWIACSN